MMDALVLLRRFCDVCYGAGDVEAAIACLADDALVVNRQGRARGRQDILHLLLTEIGFPIKPCKTEYDEENGERITDTVTEATLRITVSAGDASSSRLLFCTAVNEGGVCRIRTLRIVSTDDAQINEHYENLVSLVMNLSCGIAVCHIDADHQLTIRYLNDGYFALLEEDRESLTARYDENIVSGIYVEDRAMVQAHLDDLSMTRNGHEMTYRYITTSGKLKWIYVKTTAVKHNDGTATSYSTYTDLTEHMALQQRLTTMIDTVPCGICLYSRVKDVMLPLLFNQQYKDMLGNYVASSFTLTDDVDSLCAHSDDLPLFRDAARRVLSREKQVIFEARGRATDGLSHWMRYCLTNISTPGVGEDMTVCTVERIDVERELRRRYEMERSKPSLGENNLLAYALFNLSTGETLEYVYWDGTPVPPSDKLSFADGLKNADQLLIDDEERKQFRELNDAKDLLRRFAQGETEFTLDYRRRIPGGEIIWVRNILRLLRAPESSDVLLFEYRYDIDDDKNLEITYQRLTNRAYDLIARVNLNSRRYAIRGKASDVRAATTKHGEDADGMLMNMIEAHVHPDDREAAKRQVMTDSIRENLKEHDFFQFNCRQLSGDGAVAYKRISEYYLDRQRELAIVTCEDVTALVRSETQKNELLVGALETAKKANRAKTQFLSRMSHELRTPMNAIIGLSSLIEEDAGNARAVLDAVRKIGVSAKYLLSLINDILEMSRIESGNMELREGAFDMRELLDGVHTIVCGQIKEKSIDYQIAVKGCPEERYIGDQTKIQQILVNILGNAAKFTPAGGKILLTIEQIRRYGAHADVRFTVLDTGIGIDEKFMPRLFEPFAQETANYANGTAGTGLGLSIAKNLAQMMHGRIDAESVKGQGAVFTVEIRLGVPPEQATKQRPVDATACLNGKRILIAEDHPINAEVARRLMEKAGAEVTIAVNGLEAVELFRRSNEGEFDAVLMDIQMPIMDGLTAAKSIRALKRADSSHVPIIALTANAFDEDIEQSLAYGMDAHLAKPIDPGALYGALTNLIKP